MIEFIDKNNPLNENKCSLNVSYIRNINIIMGNFPYPEILHKFILDIENNLSSEMKNFTNVKGNMTDWSYFLDKKEFIDFLSFVINKHQNTHPEIFKHFFEKYIPYNSWGNRLKKGESVAYHDHTCLHGILYLTKGSDLILPELNLKITPEPGDYYIFPPMILHGVEPSKKEQNRYSLIFNLRENNNGFNYEKKLREI